MESDRIEKIQQHIERLRDERAQLLADQRDKERKRRTQQCIIVGAWAISNTPDIVEIVKSQLTVRSHRAAFDLEPLDEGLDLPLPLSDTHDVANR